MNNLQAHTAGGGKVQHENGLWRLHLPAGDAHTYRLAQVDDYTGLPRALFPWQPGVHLQLRARTSQAMIPGTWGFGLWNDPFSLSLGLQGGTRRFPTLPNAAWFFFASPPNALSFRDDQPGCGALTSVFSSPRIPAPLLGVAIPLLGATLWVPAGRALRRLAGHFIQQENHLVEIDTTQWHIYTLIWRANQVIWQIDGQEVSRSPWAPHPPLGLVLWVDNQYAAWGNDGRARWGILSTLEPIIVEISDLACNLLDNQGAIV